MTTVHVQKRELRDGRTMTTVHVQKGSQKRSSLNPSYDLASILDQTKLRSENMSPQIKNFYKKLLETDAQIQYLKKELYQKKPMVEPRSDESPYENMFRLKRSLFKHKKNKKRKKTNPPKIATIDSTKQSPTPTAIESKTKTFINLPDKPKSTPIVTLIKDKSVKEKQILKLRKHIKSPKHGKHKETVATTRNRVKRFPNGSEVPAFEYEKQQIAIHFKNPNKAEKPKYRDCPPKEFYDNEYELLLKHPFYKSSQHLDDLLRHLFLLTPLTKHTSSLKPDPSLLTITKGSNGKLQDNVYKAKQLSHQFLNFITTEVTPTSPEPDFEANSLQEIVTPLIYESTPLEDIAMSTLNYMSHNNVYKSYNFPKASPFDKSKEALMSLPSRKLLANEEDNDDQPEELVGYEDFKEVLSDDMGTHDETDRPIDRKRRDHQWNIEDTATTKAIPPGVYNPNWKGPLPLYPDEANSMVKEIVPMQQYLDFPLYVTSQPAKNPQGNFDNFEQYSQDDAKFAQAYSDYGVFKEKSRSKDVKSEEKSARKLVTKRMMRTKKSLLWHKSRTGKPQHTSETTKNVMGKNKYVVVANNLVNDVTKKTNELTKDILDYITITTAKAMPNHHMSNGSLTRRRRAVDKSFQLLSETATDKIGKEQNETVNELAKIKVENEKNGLNNKRNTESKLEDLFLVFSDWFAHMANLSDHNPFARNDSLKSISPNTKSNNIINVTKNIVYPLYDSDMIDNIGHRSRVLLSIEEEDTVNKTKRYNEDSSSRSETQSFGRNRSESNTTTYSPTLTLADANQSIKNEEGNKTNVKRNSGDGSELVFWNDIYDDEYGVKLEQFEDKAHRSPDLVKQSANWIQDKMRRMKDSIKKKSQESFNRFYKSREKRDAHTGFQNEKLQVNDFSALTAHMKEICKKASEVVRHTRDMKRQGDESEISSGLIQNLVKFMSDLVEYQVKQKTCLTLPEDLRVFLEWLTQPASSAKPTKKQIISALPTRGEPTVEKDEVIDTATTQSSEKEGGSDARSECLGTLQAVQDLIQDYVALSDNDKSSMGNVMLYLEGQLNYLNKQLNSIDENNLSNMDGRNAMVMPNRFRRDIVPKSRQENINYPFQASIQGMKNKFFNYNKKHTRSTISNVESVHDFSGNHKTMPELNSVERLVEPTGDISNFYESDNGIAKRNLKDVYYKAIGDAQTTTLRTSTT